MSGSHALLARMLHIACAAACHSFYMHVIAVLCPQSPNPASLGTAHVTMNLL